MFLRGLLLVGCLLSFNVFAIDAADLRQNAEQGDVFAQRTLGERYYFGKGVKQDHQQAFNWYLQAA